MDGRIVGKKKRFFVFYISGKKIAEMSSLCQQSVIHKNTCDCLLVCARDSLVPSINTQDNHNTLVSSLYWWKVQTRITAVSQNKHCSFEIHRLQPEQTAIHWKLVKYHTSFSLLCTGNCVGGESGKKCAV